MQTQLSWQAPEYYHVPKTADWYWMLGIISTVIAFLSFYYGNFLLGVLIIVATLSILVHANKEGPMRSFSLTNKGIRIENKFYPYLSLESFWVDTHEIDEYIFGKLLIKSKKSLMPLIIIPIEEVHPDEIKEFLSAFLIEEELQEPLGQKIVEYLGF